MKKPRTLKELYYLVNPKDLLMVLGFSGINAHRDKEHSKLKKSFEDIVYKSVNSDMLFKEITPGHLYYKLTDDHYNTIIRCIQDFYFWGHQFEHSYGHIYKRVVHALDIPMKEITLIMDKRIIDCERCELYSECDHQGAYKVEGKWCFE